MQASSTTETGFVGMLTLPPQFMQGAGKASGLLLPAPDEDPMLTWNRAVAFRGLLPAPAAEEPAKDAKGKDAKGKKSDAKAEEPESDNRLKNLLKEFLPGEWAVDPPVPQETTLGLTSVQGEKLRFPVRRSLLSVKRDDKGAMEWDLAWGADEQQFLELLASHAVPQGLKHTGALNCVDPKKGPSKINVDNIQERLQLGMSGFFQNGGKTAFLAFGVQAQGAAGPGKRKFLQDSFDGITAVSMLCAPGLDFSWQQSLLEYAGPRGRGDLFAVLETPRYLLTKEPRGIDLDDFRWSTGGAPYEMGELQTIPSPRATELRFSGYAADEILDRSVPRDDGGFGAAYGPWLVCDNPQSVGAHDRYIITPPSGHVAGVIAATDLKAGGGVHKAPANELVAGCADLVTSVSDVEQEALNVKGINIIRHRPGAGIRVWGARTVAADPLWTYVNVRRLFLFVERSVRDAIQWAVFLPNSDQTRADLRSTIAAFLYRLYMQGMFDGRTWQEAFSVRCDRDNNPDEDVRSGLLTVDVV